MAEERNLATARATDADTTHTTGDTDSTKAELQRKMEEARESISQTVSEIKDTVTNQYQSVRESVNDALDWREQVRRRPVAWSAGALTAGLLVGYGLGSTFMGSDSSDYERNYRAYDEDDDSDDDNRGSSSARYAAYEGARNYGSRASSTRSYAAQGITGSGGAYGTQSDASDYRPSYSSGYQKESDDGGPGLIEKFKGTQAFERLQTEVASLGDRLIDEVSNVGQNVVLPALLGKVKELFGVDLSGNSGGSQQRRNTTSGASAYGGNASSGSRTQSSQTSYGSSSSSGGGTSTGSSYGTSENTDYNTTSRDRDEYEHGGSSNAGNS